MTYLVGAGTRNYPVVHLLWALLAVSVAVVLIISALVLAGVLRHLRDQPAAHDVRLVPPARPEAGLSWIYVGSAISAAILIGAIIWTFFVLRAVAGPPANAALTIQVTGHQWWWEVHYVGHDPSRELVTANAFHIPTGKSVKLVLLSADVIHSFWVPKLTGKTEEIPGKYNVSWMEADKPGTYRGQCTLYCGLQHAHMALTVIAQPPAEFLKWFDSQLQPAAPPVGSIARQGEQDFVAHCGICHTVRGTPAGGALGPDLTHLMSRNTIAAGMLPNNPAYLSGWIADSQHFKPGNFMPVLDLSGPQLTAIRQFLEGLK